jgi:hypothetical protein
MLNMLTTYLNELNEQGVLCLQQRQSECQRKPMRTYQNKGHSKIPLIA